MLLLESFFEWWNKNPYITFAISIIGIAGFALGIFLYFKSRVRKKISFTVTMQSVILMLSDKMSKLKFLYDNREIENLYSSKIVIWNDGELTIDKNDTVHDFPIMIQLPPDHTIYDVEITKATHVANRFTLENIASNQCRLSFDYFDSKEGCVIKLLHSGGFPTVVGKIKGLKGMSRVRIIKKAKEDNRSTLLFGALFSLLGIGGLIQQHRAFSLILVLGIAFLISSFLSKPLPKELEKAYRE
jgi:hypothetical protein